MAINRSQLQRLALLRLEEAETLLRAGHPSGAYYLAGYAVECALKACIARLTREHDFPPDRASISDIYTHDFGRLLKAASLASDLERAEADRSFALNWKTVTEWKEDSRYTTHSAQEAGELLSAISDTSAGVLQWIKAHW